MKLIQVLKSTYSRPLLRELVRTLQSRSFQQGLVGGDSRAKPVKYKYPQVYDPYGPTPPPSDKILQLADRIAILLPDELKQMGSLLQERLTLPKLQLVLVEGMDLGRQGGGGGAAAVNVEEKKEKTSFDVKLVKFDAAAKIKVIKEVRAFTNLGLKEAKDMVEKVPAMLKQGVSKEEANVIIKKIEDAGGVATME